MLRLPFVLPQWGPSLFSYTRGPLPQNPNPESSTTTTSATLPPIHSSNTTSEECHLNLAYLYNFPRRNTLPLSVDSRMLLPANLISVMPMSPL